MKTRALLLGLALACALVGQNRDQSTAGPKFDIPANMKRYFVGFLLAGGKGLPELPKEGQAQLLQKHLAYIRSQVEAGKFLIAGPLLDNGRIGGMAVINVETMEEAKRITEADPMIQSGRMAMEIHPAMLPEISCVKMDYGTR